jgi:hypothetical protein
MIVSAEWNSLRVRRRQNHLTNFKIELFKWKSPDFFDRKLWAKGFHLNIKIQKKKGDKEKILIKH